MKSLMVFICLASIMAHSHCVGQADTLAFPGAEGFGKITTGGRGGKIIFVTNLNDDGPGSLRDAVQKKYPRIILFTVSGYIRLLSPLDINRGDITIAGHSAPGDGICIRDFPVSIKADNVILRFLRFRLGDESKQEADAVNGNKGVSRVIVDHCSISWATDECASFYRNKDFTLQWCIVSESLNHSVHQKGDHGYGGIWGGEGASFHHNLIAHHSSRTPRFSGSQSTPNSPAELVDFRNNVIYNWKNNNVYGGEAGRYNIVNNYYKPGPATRGATDQILNAWPSFGSFFIEGNFFFGNTEVTADNEKGIRVKGDASVSVLSQKPFTVNDVPSQSAETAFEQVLQRAGASLSRDVVDVRIVDEVRNNNPASGKNKNGIIDSQNDVGGWPELKTTPRQPDADADGMPDDWERKNGLNPNDNLDASSRSIQPPYDNIEVYLNSLVERL